MFIPVGTDAPLKHWPIATGLLIVINIACFIVQHTGSGLLSSSNRNFHEIETVPVCFFQEFDEFNLDKEPKGKDADEENWNGENGENGGIVDWNDLEGDDWGVDEDFGDEKNWWGNNGVPFVDRSEWRKHGLWIGDGLHPTQWLTSLFIHPDIWRLLGNMIFLAIFGVVVEGRMGSWQFALYYLAVGVFSSMITQILLLGVNPNLCMGASAAIYGIMMTAAFWTPKANIICMTLIWYRAYFPRIPLLIFVAAYVLIDLGIALFSQELVNTPLLHLLGALAGSIVAFIVLRMHWVDTEYQDIVSLLIELAGLDPKKVNKRPLSKREIAEKEETARERKENHKQTLERTWRSVDAHLAANNLDAAIAMGRKGCQMDPDSGWDEPRLLRLIGKLQVDKQWREVVEFSKIYLEKYTQREAAIRINLAKIYLIQKLLPRRALKTIQPLSSSQVQTTSEQNETIQQIIAEAQKQIDDGVLEIGE